MSSHQRSAYGTWLILLSFAGAWLLSSCSSGRPDFSSKDGSGGTDGTDEEGDGLGGMKSGDAEDDGSGGADGDSPGDKDGTGSGAASGGDTGETGGTGGGAQVTPPEVLSFSPEDGTTGVRSDDVFTVTFNEPMDEDSVEVSVSLTNHSTAELGFAWNPESTVLTITPLDLDYGSSANSYELVVASGALDAEGDALPSDAEMTFSTLSRVSDTLFADQVTWMNRYDSNSLPYSCAAPLGDPRVGEFSGGSIAGLVATFVSYDTSPLANAVEVESATFRAKQLAPDGSFYPAGSVVLDALEGGSITENAVRNMPVEAALGELATSANAKVSASVTTALEAGLSEHPGQQVFRLSHDGSPNNTSAYFSCTDFSLDVTYLAL